MSNQKKFCYFCLQHLSEVDYKDIETLRRFISPLGKIIKRKKRHTCSKHQRKLTQAIKRARIMALLPFVKQ